MEVPEAVPSDCSATEIAPDYSEIPVYSWRATPAPARRQSTGQKFPGGSLDFYLSHTVVRGHQHHFRTGVCPFRPAVCGGVFISVILANRVRTREWAQAHFFIGLRVCFETGPGAGTVLGFMKREEAISKIRQITERVATAAGLEIVDVELKGAGAHQKLVVVIDKPGGVTHTDCELVARESSDELDAVDPISGPYEMEVSSPGVERPLKKWQDWERFVGQKVKVVLKAPLATAEELPAPPVRAKHPAKAAETKHLDGTLSRAENQTITLELPDGTQLNVPFEQVSRANLKFEW